MTVFSYDDRESLLRHINPIIKMALIIALTILVSLSFFPAISIITILVIIAGLVFLGRFTLSEIIGRAKYFIVICLSFMVFLLLTRGIVGPGDYILGPFRFQDYDFIYAISLGLRIMVLALLSLGFVLTTDPNDLVLSMMLQLKVSHVHGYAALAAYRFIPTFSREVQKIRLAQAIRGVADERGLLNSLGRPFKLLLPLLATAIRRGERLSMAMESRALGAFPQRTFYRRTAVRSKDWLFLAVTLLLFTVIVVILIKLDLFHFNVGFTA